MHKIPSSILTLWLLGMIGLLSGCQRSQPPDLESTPPEPGPITVAPPLDPVPPPPPGPIPETPADLAQPLHLQEEMVVVRQESVVGTLKDVSGTNTLTVRAARFSSPEFSETEYVITVGLGPSSEAFLSLEQAENLTKALDSVSTVQPATGLFQSFRATYRSASDVTVSCFDGLDGPDHRPHACRIEVAGAGFATTTNGLQTLKSLLQEAARKLKEAQK